MLKDKIKKISSQLKITSQTRDLGNEIEITP
jgi:hypothetical protein